MSAPVIKLLNPGPVSMTERVRRALCSPDVCHREPEFRDLMARVRERIAAVYNEPGFTPVLLGGSGTSAVEAMLALVSPAGKALVVANGVYGERVASMLRAQSKPHEVVASTAWTSAMDLAGVERALTAGGYAHVIAVHHETTTGRLNDIGALGALCKRFGVPMLVDAVSSFAGEEIRFADWNVEAIAATANKCVHGAPGVSFVLARDEALARPGFATSVYLDLHEHAAAQTKGSAPFTLPTHVMAAFDEALAELAEEGGWRTRHATYRARSERIRRVLAELGVCLLLDREDAYGSVLTSFRLPDGCTYEALHARLKSDGFVIYAGQGKFDGAIFRIAVMGDLSNADMDRLTISLRGALGASANEKTSEGAVYLDTTLDERRALAENLDDPLNRWYRYPAAQALLRVAISLPLRPDHITYIHTLVGILGSTLVALGGQLNLVVAFILLEVRMILDCYDGVLARAKKLSSPRGRTLDELGDAVSFIALCIGMTIHVYRFRPGTPLGPIAAFGVVLLATGAMNGHAYDFYKRRLGSALKNGGDAIAEELDEKYALVRSGRGAAITRFGIWFDQWQVRLYEPRYAGGNAVGTVVSRAGQPSVRRLVKLIGVLSWDNGLALLHIGVLCGRVFDAEIVAMSYGFVMFTSALVLMRRALGSHGAATASTETTSAGGEA